VPTAVAVSFAFTDSPGVATETRTVSKVTEASLITKPVVAGLDTPLVMRVASALRPSLVGIAPVAGIGAPHMTGVVLPGGELAVTAAAAVGHASRVDIVTSDGRHRIGKVVGSDPHSGIAIVSTGGGLTPATFAGVDVETGALAITACLCATVARSAANSGSHSTVAVEVAIGKVRNVGTAATIGSGTGLVDTIEADMPVGRSPWGGVLLNGQGQVVGILDARESNARGGAGVFVPAPLAVAVARELATTHKVEPGWLGIEGSDAPDDAGARITYVMAGSPAASAGLRQGDVVEAVDSHPIDSFLDLAARVYTTPPGTPVRVVLARDGTDMTMTLTLAGGPHP
jgi:S1-C subfamily serine protease